MSNHISLVEANRTKAIEIAKAVADRVPIQNEWTGYDKSEGLDGELTKDNIITYWRPGHRGGGRDALIIFTDPVLKELKNVDWGQPITTKSDVQETFSDVVRNDTDSIYTETITHQFSKTQSLSEAVKVGAELAVKTSVSGEYAGVKASADVSLKLSAEYDRNWGESTTTTDTVSKTITVPPRTYLDYQAVRSVDKQDREIKSKADFDFQIQFVSAPGSPPLVFYKWGSIEEFVDVGQGFASLERNAYNLFINNTLDDDTVEKIKAPSDKIVKFIASYDNVTSQKIILKDTR